MHNYNYFFIKSTSDYLSLPVVTPIRVILSSLSAHLKTTLLLFRCITILDCGTSSQSCAHSDLPSGLTPTTLRSAR